MVDWLVVIYIIYRDSFWKGTNLGDKYDGLFYTFLLQYVEPYCVNDFLNMYIFSAI